MRMDDEKPCSSCYVSRQLSSVLFLSDCWYEYFFHLILGACVASPNRLQSTRPAFVRRGQPSLQRTPVPLPFPTCLVVLLSPVETGVRVSVLKATVISSSLRVFTQPRKRIIHYYYYCVFNMSNSVNEISTLHGLGSGCWWWWQDTR